jgi:hypothetical protein
MSGDRTKKARDYFGSKKPGAEIDSRKERFERVLAYITASGGWITSVPGAATVDFETLPDSTLPADLRKAGYDVTEIGEGERILPNAIEQRMAMNANGELEETTPNSTKPITEVRRHAGIVRVMRFDFSI